MPALNWDAFALLPGSADANFEMLCRALVRRHYARFGIFAALANQPGVEFHLRLTSDCSLGKSGRWFGWQCRWYDLPAAKPLGAARKKKIKDAVTLSEKVLPDLTDWVLWTRRTLTKEDQNWFYALTTNLTLHLWTADEVEAHLSGEATIFRGTYFGELVLTPDALNALHQHAIAPMRQRWKQDLHQSVEAEREIRRLLGESGSWNVLEKTAQQLAVDADRIQSDRGSLEAPLSDSVAEVVQLARYVSSSLKASFAALEEGDFDALRQGDAAKSAAQVKAFSPLPGRLRARQHPTALSITNGLADIQRAQVLLSQLTMLPRQRSVFILAEAGSGKTQLSAQLTVATSIRPAGILLRGKDLRAGATLDELAKRVVIQGIPVASFEALIAAVDAAGQRSKKRLPIVIDGLNEAEDPRDWKDQLSIADQFLEDYPYVLLVGTLRPAFKDEVLPSDAVTFSFSDFGADALEAIRRYFRHYRINTTDFEFPIEFLTHPLTLFLFCEVANSKRDKDVGVENMPGSLTALFERYLVQVSERIVQLAPRTRRYFQHDIAAALYEVGAALWAEKDRTLDFDALRKRLNDDTRPWDQSIVRALEQEGVLLRDPGNSQSGQRVTAASDALGGYLCANAILADQGGLAFEGWAKSASTQAALEQTGPDRHPLGDDILSGLIGLFPRRKPRQQLWMFFDSELRTRALYGAAYLEGAYLDGATVNEIRSLLVEGPSATWLFGRLKQTRGTEGYPLNSQFLDSVLSSMSIAERDSRWTEWIRSNGKNLLMDVSRLERRWRTNPDRGSEIEHQRARWVMWLLTSTVRELRDRATRASYWFGRLRPKAFFTLVLRSLSINDPYVPERMLAAAYGVCMALHCRPARPKFRTVLLARFARTLFTRMFAVNAPYSTTHELSRDYARRIIDLARLHTPDLLNADELPRVIPPFKDGGIRQWAVIVDPNEGQYRSGNSPLGMDFANYTIGSLVPDRSTYNFEHEGYKKVLGSIVWRIYQLGYSLQAFGEIDKNIAASRYRDRGRRPPTERYGKKYARIAYFEQYGYRKDLDLLKHPCEGEDGRSLDSDIDPSFPDDPPVARIMEDLLGDRFLDVSKWVREGPSPNFGRYLIYSAFGEALGPWIMLDASCRQDDDAAERIGTVRVECLLLLKEDETEFRRLIRRMSPEGGGGIPNMNEDRTAFAGEIAWCDTVAHNELHTLSFVVGQRQVKVSHDDPWNLFRVLESAEAASKPTFEKVKVYKSIPVYSPVRRNSFSTDATLKRASCVVPAKEFVQEFKLCLDLPTWNMRDESGALSSSAFDTGGLVDAERYLFLRQELIDRLLSSQNLSLVWIVWGERQHYSENQSTMETSPGYRYFRQVFRYSKGKAVQVY